MKGLVAAWYKKSKWLYLLAPLAQLYRCGLYFRRRIQTAPKRSACPVIVVGNLTVGGTGKTPFVIALAHYLHSKNFRVGIISRGYGGQSSYYPREVLAKDNAAEVGDEPLLIKRAVGCPVVIAPKRDKALHFLLAQHACDVVISDDGLQHAALARRIEIVLFKSSLGVGNGKLLPQGPLRAELSSLKTVNACVINGKEPANELIQTLKAQAPHLKTYFAKSRLISLYRLGHNEAVPLTALSHHKLHAVCGIADPDSFFNALSEQGLSIEPHPFADHHRFTQAELMAISTSAQEPILMTEKDATKCELFSDLPIWVVRMELAIDPLLLAQIEAELSKK